MRVPDHDNIVRREAREQRAVRKALAQEDLRQYGGEILDSEELRNAYEQTHHLWSTVGEHTLRVAATSLAICYALRKLHIRTEVEDVVVGSLCHDLGILGRDEKYQNNHECSREHPVDSVRVAEDLVPALSDRSKDIIERHMWPVSGKRPNSREGVIVSVADKYCSLQDLIRGSDRRQTGVRNTVIHARGAAKATLGEAKVSAKASFEDARGAANINVRKARRNIRRLRKAIGGSAHDAARRAGKKTLLTSRSIFAGTGKVEAGRKALHQWKEKRE